MRSYICKLFLNILLVFSVIVFISCNVKYSKKSQMQFGLLQNNGIEQKEFVKYNNINDIFLEFDKIKVSLPRDLTFTLDVFDSSSIDFKELKCIYIHQKAMLNTYYSPDNYFYNRVLNIVAHKINENQFRQISKKIIKNYLKDEQLYYVVKDNAKLIDLINPVSVQELLLQKFNKVPESYTKLFQKCPSSILNLITNYYITYNVEEELVKLTKSLQNIKLYEYYENFKKNLFYTTNNDKVLSSLKVHIEYLNDIYNYIERIDILKSMYRNELINIKNFCTLFKNIANKGILKDFKKKSELNDYKKDLKFSKKHKLLLHEFLIIKLSEKDILKNYFYVLKYISGKSKIKSWVLDLKFFDKLINTQIVNACNEISQFENKYLINILEETPAGSSPACFISFIKILCDYNFGSLFVYLSGIYPLIEIFFDDITYLKYYKHFEFYFLKEAINKIIEYKDSINTISNFMKLKNFIKKKSSFDNKMLNKTIEKKAVNILLKNNITKTKAEKSEFIKRLLDKYVLIENNISIYDEMMIGYIIRQSQFFL